MISTLLAYVCDSLSHQKAKKKLLSRLPEANMVSHLSQILSEV